MDVLGPISFNTNGSVVTRGPVPFSRARSSMAAAWTCVAAVDDGRRSRISFAVASACCGAPSTRTCEEWLDGRCEPSRGTPTRCRRISDHQEVERDNFSITAISLLGMPK